MDNFAWDRTIHTTVPSPRRATEWMDTMADPTVVVDNLHVVYRVYGAGGNKGTAATSLMRLVRRQRRVSIDRKSVV